ncbi:terpenoid cyclases/protein prenyltransferase alpha-alpha toroid [Xylaria sp. FL1042]|nr:terpenoid cyclases/protein prenyltransferase alpha-alpha toroid [Xylaria sp. FL1042]
MAQQQHGNRLDEDVRRALRQAVQFSWACQKPDGHWVAPVSGDATYTAQYVMFKYAIPGLSLEEDSDAIRKWLFAHQTEDGSWTLAPGLPGNLSTTIEAYLALKILGVSASHPAMKRARGFVLSNGGVARVRFFTRLFLAAFGLFPWTAVPQMPAELILMPTWATLNPYVLSSWARSVLIPLLIVRHHEPVYPLPNGYSIDNDFLDELWLDPSDKNVSCAPPLWELFWGKDRDAIKWLCVAGDRVLKTLGGLKKGPQRRLARQRCVDWLLEHQEEQGDWGGFFPAMHGSIWALLLEGFPLQHKAVQLGLEALERLAITDDKGKWLQPCQSPCWDTALMGTALCDAGLGSDPRLDQAAEWLQDRQAIVDHGDWRIYSSNKQPGGWSFEYYNTFYPDVDDTAAVIMFLVKQNPSAIASECVLNGVTWILGMQNTNGGWGAFDINNDAEWLHKIPFSDMDSLIDPSTSDLTGRILECFGLLLASRRGACLPEQFQHRLTAAAKRALRFLIREQESRGVASGSWWGRWGNNYNYGTANVLRGLEFWCHDNPEVTQMAMRAICWFRQCQNADGGWGETLLSYADPSLAGKGESTSAQTSWAVDSLLHYLPPSDPAIIRGIQWLIFNQTVKYEYGEGMSWRTDLYMGTGFPKWIYLGYPYYHHSFAIQALSGYLRCRELQELQTIGPYKIEIPPPIASKMSRTDVLLAVIGDPRNAEEFIRLVPKLPNHRLRIIIHSAYPRVIREQCFEFDEPNELSRTLRKQPNTNGKISILGWSLGLPFHRFLIRSHERTVMQLMEDNGPERPFIADVVVTTKADYHAAEGMILKHVDLLETSSRCIVIPALNADWQHKLTGLLLSGAAATSLVHSKTLVWADLQVLSQPRRDIRRHVRESASSNKWSFRVAFAPIVATAARTFRLFGNLGGSKAAGTLSKKVSHARTRRGQFDLKLMKEHMDNGEANNLDAALAKVWEVEVAAKFHESFMETA